MSKEKELVQNLEKALLDLFPSHYSCMVGEELKVTIEVNNLDECNNNFSIGIKQLYLTGGARASIGNLNEDTVCLIAYHIPGVIKVMIKNLENE